MELALASTPLIVAIVLIIGFGQSALRTGLAGLAVTVLITLTAPPFLLDLHGLGRGLGRGLLTSVGVCYVLLGGVTLYHVMRLGNGLAPLAEAVARGIPDPGVRVLSLVFGVSVFFESATGFGVGIIVTAPLFMALGYSPLRAATLALVGQCAVPWGALAVGTVLGSELSGIPLSELGVQAVFLSLPYLVASGLVALRVAGVPLMREARLAWLCALVMVLGVSLWATSRWISVELAGCVGGLAVVAVTLRPLRHAPRAGNDLLRRALFPLAVLLVSLIVTRMVPAAREILTGLLEFRAPAQGFALAPLHHPGFWLLVAAMAGGVSLSLKGPEVRQVLHAASRQWLIAAAAVSGFLCLGQVMVESGMTTTMASALAGAAGTSYALAVPVIGALGGFLTASNAASNALFMTLQLEAAASVGLPLEPVAAAQNAAGSNITLASPGRVVLAAAVAGQPGAEAALIRKVLPLGLAGLAGTIAVAACGLL